MDKVWDTETQEVHGGQTWQTCANFLSDFSVTTNAFGPPEAALRAAHDALSTIQHYPAADNAAALRALAAFTDWPVSQLLLGNGASEFIDLAMRALPPGPFKPGPYVAAYMEYARAAKAAGRELLDPHDQRDAAVTVVIHPNSPTGDCISLHDLRSMLEKGKGIVVVDESFMPFRGPTWRKESALSLVHDFPARLIVITSWTKVWSCPGLRLGSIAASVEWIRTFKTLQTPWSLNVAAHAFCIEACKDAAYMKRTWNTLPGWKFETERALRDMGWKVNENSPEWVPWVFVNVGNEKLAQRAVEVAQSVGCPIRPCASFGLPTFIRLGIRMPQHQKILFEAWKEEFGERKANGDVNGVVINGRT